MTQNGRRRPEIRGQRFAQLYLEKLAHFQQADLKLQRRVFLVWPNASEKPNLLDVSCMTSYRWADLFRDEGIDLDEVFLLAPGKEGTEVRAASTLTEIKEFLEGGVSLPEAVIPRTKRDRAEQLTLFADTK